ncbi:UDP-N-acetylmuramoyl-L-alanine--D-glutamate ligase [Paenibacillus sp. LHD-38]|uniref:UDP-N-acetylmuramoyl-L-alanine--D-glutamate ligase n=1 Tax=Paenibacillus sp. LHD-38 TaxID=3072143 RepID=UPI00280EA25A|nr:UDP-N-acetylmuramoyl-L-alanine--D-glutamate ligase [Paenibacillus sp. LHD-38]MDQ8735817.1 UDP-N-acetylmuramoyl-L-alanine--D-glutamate ligase [Paenibacillus sp. LHD-38]
MKHPRDYCNKEVIIIGLAKSGVASAKLFHNFGAIVKVNDKKERDLCPEAEELEAMGISVVCGFHSTNLIHPGVSLVVKNPGIPYSTSPVQKALDLGIEIVSEVEVAFQISHTPIIGITGSNGKTTVTTWIGKLLEKVGMSPVIAGNIGVPLCEVAQQLTARNTLVVELSSFQLKGTVNFRPKVALLLNITPTHLDYHGSVEDYVSSKAKLFDNQTSEDIAVINWDDSACQSLIPHIKAKVIPFSVKEELNTGVYLKETNDRSCVIFRDHNGKEEQIVLVDDLCMPAKIYIENTLAVTAVGKAAGIKSEIIAQVLCDLDAVEHRIEFVSEQNGISFYNDSKATNPAATIKALHSFDAPIVLIAGGLERNMEYFELIPHLKNKVKAVIAIGETKNKIEHIAQEAAIRNIVLIENEPVAADTMTKAVQFATDLTEVGDIILLSPACASWDMFATFEERGQIFKQAVLGLYK